MPLNASVLISIYSSVRCIYIVVLLHFRRPLFRARLVCSELEITVFYDGHEEWKKAFIGCHKLVDKDVMHSLFYLLDNVS